MSFPRLRWNDGEWTASIVLRAWQGFQSRLGPYNGLNSKRPSTGKVRLRVLTENDERIPPTPAQQQTYAHLVERQRPLRDAILKAVLKAYAKFSRDRADFPLPAQRGKPSLPRKFNNVDKLKSHIGLASIYILPEAKSGYAYVGYGFGCSWDEEHGLGVATHRSRILEVGGEDVAFMSDAVEKERQAAKKAHGSAVPSELKFEDLNRAVMDGNKPWVKALLDAGAVPDKRYHGPGTSTAIHMAVSHGESEILELFLKIAKRRLPQQLMRTAVYVREPRIIKVLAKHGLTAPAE